MNTLKTIFPLILFIYLNKPSFAQIQPMGFTHKVLTMDGSFYVYYPKLQVIDDTLFVSTNIGIYHKDLKQDTQWSLYAFEDAPVIEFVRNENKLIANSMGAWNEQDSLLLLSEDNGKSYIDYTSPYFLENGKNQIYRLHQNPQNSNSILAMTRRTGLSKSEDFGENWNCLNSYGLGIHIAFASFHPLDTTTIFYSGEGYMNEGRIYKSSDSGETWSDYVIPGGDNCVHQIDFHPTNPDVLVFGGEGVIGRSVDKGETWAITDLFTSGMYFYKVLFDKDNPNTIYASGTHGDREENNTIFVYRSIDMGETWHLAYQEALDSDCGEMIDMVMHNKSLIFYTDSCGLFELNVETTPPLSVIPSEVISGLSVYPNPVHSTLYFETSEDISNVDIVDCTGCLLQKTIISENERTVDVSGLCTGIYFAIFQTDNQKITRKIYIDN
ncbi:MAG: VPS10 domain-containing protein [Dysgonomonas sp.]